MITYTRKLFDFIRYEIGAHNISLEFNDSDDVYFKHSTKTIVLGRQHLYNIWHSGFIEYDEINFVWNDWYDMKKHEAAWACLLHEFAHYLADEIGHTEKFIEQLKILIELFDFGELALDKKA